MKYAIGVDDHDSPIGGCTTHFSTILINYFIKNNIHILDFPYLIRLNPNIPWKTRGNAAIRINVDFDGTKKELADMVWSKSLEYVKEVSKGLEYNRKPGVAIIDLEKSPELYNFYVKTVSDVIPIDLAVKVSEKIGAEIRGYRGIIGSLAAIGFKGNITYELLTYRYQEYFGKKREIDYETVIQFDNGNFPLAFANYDYIKKNPLILSHGNDPVLYGIRGVEIDPLILGLNTIKVKEPIYNAMIFKSNQGTDAHLIKSGDKTYQTFKGECEIREVKILSGGDVLISCNNLKVMIYKETGELNLAAKMLTHGDEIEIIGAIKPSSTFGKIIEAERIRIIKLQSTKKKNPRCPKCDGPSESVGKNKGFRCKKCGYRFFSEKENIIISRNLSLGIYQARYYRHLTRPIFLEFKNKKDYNFLEIYNKIQNIINKYNKFVLNR
jgi:tRNA(Ile2)-agmatinylcytidine synthase